MRMHEIITVSGSQPSVEVDERELETMKAFFSEARSLQLPHNLEVKERADSFYRWLGIFKQGEIFGWAKLKPTTVAGIEAHAVELVYIVPRFRKSLAAGWLFLYAKDLVGTPIVLGDDTNYGGVAFKDGEDLIAALVRADKFDISLLDVKTGSKRPLTLPLRDNRFTTVIIESMVDLAIARRLAEAHAVPGAAAREGYHSVLEWLQDITETAP